MNYKMSLEECLKRSSIWLSIVDLNSENCDFDEFLRSLTDQCKINLDKLRDFIENTKSRPYLIFKPWSEEHFMKIHLNPKILNDYSFLSLPDETDLVVGYGVWCERNYYRINYKNAKGERLINENIEEFIESHKLKSSYIDDCLANDAIITVLAMLLDIDFTIKNHDGHTIERTNLIPIDIGANIFLKTLNHKDVKYRRWMNLFKMSKDTCYGYSPITFATYIGSLNFVKYYLKMNLFIDDEIITIALREHRLEIAEYLFDKTGIFPSIFIYLQILKYGRKGPLLDVFKCVHERFSVPINATEDFMSNFFDHVFEYGEIDLLHYVFEHISCSCIENSNNDDYPRRIKFFIINKVNKDSFIYIIKFLLNRGFIWDSSTYFFSKLVGQGHGDCDSPEIQIPEEDLKTLIDLGCPYQDNFRIIEESIKFKSLDFVKLVCTQPISNENFMKSLFFNYPKSASLRDYAIFFKQIGGEITNLLFLEIFKNQNCNSFRTKIDLDKSENEIKFLKLAFQVGVPLQCGIREELFNKMHQIKSESSYPYLNEYNKLVFEMLTDLTRIMGYSS